MNKFAFIVAKESIECLVNSESFKKFAPFFKKSYISLEEKNKMGDVLKNAIDNIEENAGLYVGVFCSNISDKRFCKKEIHNNALIKTLHTEKVIINDKHNNDYAYFDDVIKTNDSLARFLENKGINATSDIMLVFKNLQNSGRINWSAKPSNNDLNRFERCQKILIALANNTPEFLKFFQEPNQYAVDNNIARGEEIIMLERRGWVLASARMGEENTGTSRYRFGIVESLLYSIETVLSTISSIETFNKNLEMNVKNISHEFNLLVNKYYNKDRGNKDLSGNTNINKEKKSELNAIINKLEEFVSIISKARSISPCEDITTSMEAHVKSQTSVKAIIKLKGFGLERIIDLARYRMRNYGYFLQTGHDVVMAEKRKISKISEYY